MHLATTVATPPATTDMVVLCANSNHVLNALHAITQTVRFLKTRTLRAERPGFAGGRGTMLVAGIHTPLQTSLTPEKPLFRENGSDSSRLAGGNPISKPAPLRRRFPQNSVSVSVAAVAVHPLLLVPVATLMLHCPPVA